jgi:ferredoxin-thioredoxin reductase catalytic subunit
MFNHAHKVDVEYVTKHIKDGWALNPNDKIVTGIINGINRNNGECPCANTSEDKHCPCSNYREHDYCCCTLYVKQEQPCE